MLSDSDVLRKKLVSITIYKFKLVSTIIIRSYAMLYGQCINFTHLNSFE